MSAHSSRVCTSSPTWMGCSMRRLFKAIFDSKCASATSVGMALLSLSASAAVGTSRSRMQTATLPVATESRDHYDHCTESCSTQAIPAAEKAYLYLVETAKPGGTMTRQGADLAVRRLHPEFATRLAAAIREAREVGLPETAIFAAYRPPAYGVGGFGDKFKSLHSYGLAVDGEGIGGPASWQAKL